MAEHASKTAALSRHFALTIRQRTEDLIRRRRDPDQGTDDLIHEIRLVTKEFRAYLNLLDDTVAAPRLKREDKRLRDTAQSLAADRDLLVIRETLERLATRCRQVAGRHSLHRILLHLGEQRPIQQNQKKIDQAIAAVCRVGHIMTRQFRSRQSDDPLMRQIIGEYRRTRHMTQKKRKSPSVDSWHRWRKQVKACHFQIVCLTEYLPANARRLCRDTSKLQSILGRYHDLDVARSRVKRLRIDPINEPCRWRTCKLIDKEVRRLEKKVAKFGRSLFQTKPAKFGEKLQNVRRKIQSTPAVKW